MELSLLRDIRQLLLDAEKIQRDLEMLKKDHVAWARQCQQNDLTHFIEHVKRLELDVIWMLSDCIALTHPCKEDGIQAVLDCLHRALATLNSLFNDLKNARMALNETYIHPADLQHLVIDLGRLRKSINQVQKNLQAGDSILNLIKAKKAIPYQPN